MRLTLTAPAAVVADLADEARTIAGVVVPYGTDGNTSAGRLKFRPGSLSWPEDLSRVKLTREHDRTAPRGYAVTADDGADALRMTFRAARTPAGEEALLEAAEHVRDGFSVDLDEVTVTGGEVTAGRIVAVGQVAVPAYADARVAASETEPESQPEPDTDQPTEPEEVEEQEERTVSETTTIEQPGTGLQAAAVPPNLPRPGGRAGIGSMAELYRALTAAHTGAAGPALTAALADITRTANAWVQPTQYEGELWQGLTYERQIVPLVGSGNLTSWEVAGWRWKVKPVVAPWAGDKAAVPSNAAVTEAVKIEAERLAGAHDFDRKFRDFGDTAFFESYYSAMRESYGLLSDEALLTDLLAAATVITPTAGDTVWQTIMWMALAVATVAPPTFVLVGASVLAELVGTTQQEAPAFLALLPDGLPPIRSFRTMPTDQILVGARAGSTFFELPGSPIRVEAVDMVKGGIDGGVFGYYATNVHQPLAYAKATVTLSATRELPDPYKQLVPQLEGRESRYAQQQEAAAPTAKKTATAPA